jgi:hypothetical protein
MVEFEGTVIVIQPMRLNHMTFFPQEDKGSCSLYSLPVLETAEIKTLDWTSSN